MKPISLSKEQKRKLIKMCKVLYPEYNFIKVINDKVVLGKENKEIDDFFIDFEEPIVQINWFEFVMTYLVNKIYYIDGKEKVNKCNIGKYFFFQSFINSVESKPSGYDHPVDYLYEQFKK